MDLLSKKCVPCEGGVPPFSNEEIEKYLQEIKGWRVSDGRKIEKSFGFKNFREAMDFVNKVAALAEEENHHPDIQVSYNNVRLVVWTHAIGGLSENDFILAAKIDSIFKTKVY